MLSFHNDPAIKQKYISRVMAHREADEIIKGVYWEKGKGCAVGCTIHGNDHSKYETELGIPIILARLEDGIFENIPDELAKEWPFKFLDSIKIGADLTGVWPRFAVWLLTDETHGVLQYAKSKKSKNAIQKVAHLYKRHHEVTKQEWNAAAADAAAYAYADAAAYAAADAAYAYADADAAAYAAADAAYAYAYADAAAAAYAAADAAYAYADADAAADADADARKNHRIAQSEKLLELLIECK